MLGYAGIAVFFIIGWKAVEIRSIRKIGSTDKEPGGAIRQIREILC